MINKFTKTSFITAVVLLIYGYACRILNIYFFWDSKELGWIVLFISLGGYLFCLKKVRRRQGKKTFWTKVGLFVTLTGLLILPIVVFMFKKSEAYEAMLDYIKNDPEIKYEIGDFKGIGIIPTGQLQTRSLNGMESGNAIFSITIRGSKKYKEVSVTLQKTPETEWTVVSIE